jgi:hypothetical protein
MVFGEDGELVETPVIVEEKKTKQRVRDQGIYSYRLLK